MPILIIAAGALIFCDPVTPRQAVGITFSLTGVLVVVAHGTIETLVDVSFNASNSKSSHHEVFHSFFWTFRSSGGMVKVARDSRKTGQDGKTT